MCRFGASWSPGPCSSWTQQTDSNAPVTYRYGYDGADELLAVTKSGTSQSPIDAYAYRYDAAGNRTVEQIDSSVTSSAYNALNQMTSRGGGGLLTVSGSLNEPGTITVGTGQPYITGTISTAFSLTTPVVTGSNSIQISATDANGNGATHVLQVNVTSGTPIPALQYDADGNLINDGTMTYEFDAANRVTAVNETGGLRSEFAYDGLGHRVRITEKSSGTVTSVKNLIWEGMTIAEARNQTNTLTNRYFPEGVQMSGTSFYYTRDHLGSIREVTGANAVVQGRYDYDPYGRETQLSGTMMADFGYTGFYYHQPSGMFMAPYRPYLPSLARWGSRDPLCSTPPFLGLGIFKPKPKTTIGELVLGPNLYIYASNQPINQIDPSGLAEVPPVLPPAPYIYICAAENQETGIVTHFHPAYRSKICKDDKAKHCCQEALDFWNELRELDPPEGIVASRIVAVVEYAEAGELFYNCMASP